MVDVLLIFDFLDGQLGLLIGLLKPFIAFWFLFDYAVGSLDGDASLG